MSDSLYLAWRYLVYHRIKTVVLVCAITLIVYVPVGLNILVNQSAKTLHARAQTTPLLIGAKGSPLELVLNSLYYESDVPPAMQHAEVTRIEQSGLASAIPLYTRFRTRHSPIVGTSHDYFTFRGLEIGEGRHVEMLGDCVLGSHAARKASAAVGDSVMSQPENVFDLAGVYPLKMHVVGVLKPTGTPDDHAVFVSVKTTWVIQGLGHGHVNVDRSGEPTESQGEDGDRTATHASVMKYNEITRDNVASFHFHGDPDSFPITAAIALPSDAKSSALLQGRYLGDDELVQIVRPAPVMLELLETVITVQRYLTLAAAVIGVATLATMTLVFMLAIQLRRREIETMMKIGASRWRVVSCIATEIFAVLATGMLLASGLSLATSWFASEAAQLLILI